MLCSSCEVVFRNCDLQKRSWWYEIDHIYDLEMSLPCEVRTYMDKESTSYVVDETSKISKIWLNLINILDLLFLGGLVLIVILMICMTSTLESIIILSITFSTSSSSSLTSSNFFALYKAGKTSRIYEVFDDISNLVNTLWLCCRCFDYIYIFWLSQHSLKKEALMELVVSLS